MNTSGKQRKLISYHHHFMQHSNRRRNITRPSLDSLALSMVDSLGETISSMSSINTSQSMSATIIDSQDSREEQAESLYQQGHFFLHYATPRKPELAFAKFTAASALGSLAAKHQQAYCLQHGVGVEKDEKKAVSIYSKLCAEPNPMAASLNQLGICYHLGIGVEIDEERAVTCYKRAAELGNQDAMFNYAYCLRRGTNTQQDNEKAYSIYVKLAEMGDLQGMKLAGNCKAIGLGTTASYEEALDLFKKASESDTYWGAKSQYAIYLLNGIGTEPDHVKAFQILSETCDRWPCVPGTIKILLGRCYHFGVGVGQDLDAALYWYERALRSYGMSMSLVDECEFLIKDVREKLVSTKKGC
ncbi:5563_t:CDS:2 [Ambispora leptoticha]|uniref:5563_t:CDS:1 n=1 Tax=Ambispora leptoticha TaxID=144679 RepID=A0A9N9A9F4_9GLOM|nr:5563_t:CDS:2 [Ambispora leptoticha]